MKVSLRWLREYAPLDAPLNVIVRSLSDTGTEVGSVEDVANGIVVARVVGLEPLPGSKHGLLLADIDVGPAPPPVLIELGVPTTPLRLVTGAPNLGVGNLVPYAPPGSTPPALDEPLGVRTYRGRYTSPGMLLSEVELGLGSNAAGIMILERGSPGQPLRDVVDLDVVLDLDVTTNRPDCLCHMGIARELAAVLGETLSEPDTAIPEALQSAASSERRARIQIEDPQGCPRFCACVIEGVQPGASPDWMQERLRAIGLRPINNVVDVTNYVAHELGQPLHAFDLDRMVAVAGGAHKRADVVVRRARAGERLVLLDGAERELSSEDMVVCAGERVASLAGVMGGAETAVGESTRSILLEAANWDPLAIRATSRRLELRTDASTLFEKGLSDTLPPLALGRAATLIAELSHGHVLRGVIDVWPAPLPEIPPISVSARFMSDLLGTNVDATEAATTLAHLGFAVEQDGATLLVAPPHFRRDVRIREDVVEEVGRMLGYDKVPSTLPGRRSPLAGTAPDVPLEDIVRDVCTGAGFDEAITFSFISPAAARSVPGLGEERTPIPLRNPLSEEWGVMRTSQLPGLCASLAGNVNRGVVEPALFEVGRVFWEGERRGLAAGSTPDGADRALTPLPLEPLLLSVAAHAGDAVAATRSLRHVQSLFAWLITEVAGAASSSVPVATATLRSGRAAQLRIAERNVGLIGELRADVVGAVGIRGRVVVGELRLDAIVPDTPRPRRFMPPPRFPAIVQDLSITVPDDRLAGEALEVVRRAGGTLLEDAELYDEYRGEGVSPGRKGWTFRLTFRAPDRTLTGEEAQRSQDAVTIALTQQSAAEVRR